MAATPLFTANLFAKESDQGTIWNRAQSNPSSRSPATPHYQSSSKFGNSNHGNDDSYDHSTAFIRHNDKNGSGNSSGGGEAEEVAVRYGSGAEYVGGWQNGKRHGHGTMTFSDGTSKLEGEFNKGYLMNGHGTSWESGRVVQGSWVRGQLQGPCTITNTADGSTLQGEFHAGRIRSGEGTLVLDRAVGERQVGRWAEGVFSGQAYRVRGEEQGKGAAYRYTGAVLDGRWHGSGKVEYARKPYVQGGSNSSSEVAGGVSARFLEGKFEEGELVSGTGLVYSGTEAFAQCYQGEWPVLEETEALGRRDGGRKVSQVILGDFIDSTVFSGQGYVLARDGAAYACRWAQGSRVVALRPVEPGSFEAKEAHRLLALLGVLDTHTAQSKFHSSRQEGASFNGARDEYGNPHGHGVLTMPSGDFLEGNFSHGKLNGYGEHWYADGGIFKGHYFNNVRHGRGKLIYADGKTTLEGEFRRGNIFEGRGALRDRRTGDLSVGVWRGGYLEGPGKMVYASGREVRGEFTTGRFRATPTAAGNKAAERAGSGEAPSSSSTVSSSRVSSVSGSSSEDAHAPAVLPSAGAVALTAVAAAEHATAAVSGADVAATAVDTVAPAAAATAASKVQQVILTSGDVLVGVFKAFGKLHGFGEYRYASDGRVYRGNFRRGDRHGEGTLTYADGRTLQGLFRHGKFTTGRGLMVRANGERLEGTWEEGLFTGTGKKVFPDGRTLEGRFEDDKIVDGVGFSDLGQGFSYEGEYKNGLLHGKGVFCFPDGSRREGLFKRGELHAGQETRVGADGAVLILQWVGGRCVG